VKRNHPVGCATVVFKPDVGAIKIKAPIWLIAAFGIDRKPVRQFPVESDSHSHLAVGEDGMVQLRDRSLLCTSYAWAWVQNEAIAKMKQVVHYGNFVFAGGYLVRSEDGGHHWDGPIIPAPCQGETARDMYGQPVPAYNRGALCEGKDGRLYWVVASNTSTNSRQTETHLMVPQT